MFITRLSLQNWRNFVEVDVPLRQRTFIVGPNASGKSNLLDAILFLRDVLNEAGNLHSALECRGGFTNVRSHYNSNAQVTTIAVELDECAWPDHAEWRYALQFAEDPTAPGGARLVSEELRRNGQVCVRSPDANHSALTSCGDWRRVNADLQRVAETLSSIRYLNGVSTLPHSSRAYTPANSATIIHQIANADPVEREHKLEQVRHALQTLLPEITSLQIHQNEDAQSPRLMVTHKQWCAGEPLDAQFSDGTLSLIAILWSLLETEGPLLIEHPENSMQTAILPHLAWAFARSGDPPHRQVLATTHAFDLLFDDGIAPEEVLIVTPSAGGSTVATGDDDVSAVAVAQAGGSAGELLIGRANGRVGLEINLRLE